MRRGAASTLGALVVLIGLVGCETTTVEDDARGTVASPIVGGMLDGDDPAVVAIVSRRQRCASLDVDIVCTGTVVAPRVVVTAGHCLRELGPPGAFEVFFGDDTHAGNGRFIVARAAARHPKLDDAAHAYDVGILLLAEDAPASAVQIASGPLPASFVGSSVRAVGFGRAALQGALDGKKREGTMTVSAITALSYTTVTAPAMTCQGDSGGPVFGQVDGVEKLVGLTVAGDGDCKDHAINGRLDVVWDDFLRGYVDGTNPVSVEPSTVATVPVSGLCDVACATDADCPALLACVALPGAPPRCALPGGVDGNLTTVCTTDDACGVGRLCQRLWPSGADACRCNAPCQTEPTGIPMDAGPKPMPSTAPTRPRELVGGRGNLGCSVRAGASSPAIALGAVSLGAVWLARRRRRRG